MRTVNGAAELLEALQDKDSVIATETLFSGMIAIGLPGQRVSYREPMVRQHPDCFVPVLRPGVDPAAAVRCIAPIDVQAEAPAPPWHTRRIAWPGQLFNRGDELVQARPEAFGEALQ